MVAPSPTGGGDAFTGGATRPRPTPPSTRETWKPPPSSTTGSRANTRRRPRQARRAARSESSPRAGPQPPGAERGRVPPGEAGRDRRGRHPPRAVLVEDVGAAAPDDLGEARFRDHVVPLRDVGRLLVLAQLPTNNGGGLVGARRGRRPRLHAGRRRVIFSAGDPNRGDLPLALAITSFLPTRRLLDQRTSRAITQNAKTWRSMTAGAGLVSVPIAHPCGAPPRSRSGRHAARARRRLLWGLVLGTTSMLASSADSTVDGGFGYSLLPGAVRPEGVRDEPQSGSTAASGSAPSPPPTARSRWNAFA